MSLYDKGQTVLGGDWYDTSGRPPMQVTVKQPWWQNAALGVGVLASLATLWMASNWIKMMKKRRDA